MRFAFWQQLATAVDPCHGNWSRSRKAKKKKHDLTLKLQEMQSFLVTSFISFGDFQHGRMFAFGFLEWVRGFFNLFVL